MNVPVERIADAATFGRVAVLMGGSSSEREVSLDSGRAVLSALQARGVDARAIDGVPGLLQALQADTVDRVFNVLHGSHGGGEDGVLQGLLEAFRVPCTGSCVLGSALAMDKIRTKQVWMSMGLPTPHYLRLSPGDDVHAAAASLGLPVIIKPSSEGSSVGISRVFDDAGLEAAVALAAQYPGELLMERQIQGKQEFSVGILGRVALPSVCIIPAGDYYDYHAKYIADDTQYVCPGLQGDAETEIRRLALAAFAAAACTGWGRVDVMRDPDGGFQLIEINTAPGMTSHSLVPKAAAQLGIDFESLCWQILEMTLAEATP